MLSCAERRIGRHEHRGNDREILCDVVGDRKRGQRAARDQQLLSDRDNFDELGWIAVEVHHVAGFFGGHRARVHGHADVGLRQRRRIVGAVAGHCDEPAGGLFLLDVFELVLRRRLSQKIVDPGFGGNGRGGQRVVARDHDAANAHQAKLRNPLLHSALDDVFQVDEAEQAAAVGHRQRRPATPGDAIAQFLKIAGNLAAPLDRRTCVIASVAPLRSCRPSKSTPLIRV